MRKSLATLAAGTLLWALVLAGAASAQRAGTIDAGTTITVRTNEDIDTKDADGRIYSGVAEQDIRNQFGEIVVPKGANVELAIKKVSPTEMALDLDSIMVNGQRFAVDPESNIAGGATVASIIGAMSGGARGTAIVAGAGAQLQTRGQHVKIPVEALLTFRLDKPLRAGVLDTGFITNGVHYHQGYSGTGRGDIALEANNNVSWHSSDQNSTVYVLMDNEPPKLFATGQSGTQTATWVADGHVYTFVLKDGDGKEIARETLDLRQPAFSR